MKVGRISLPLSFALAFVLATSAAPTATSAGEAALLPAPATEASLPETCLGNALWLTTDECEDECNLYFEWCLDGCDIDPYPGCYNDCRAARWACYQDCWS